MKKILVTLATTLVGLMALTAQAEVGNSEALYNDADISSLMEILEGPQAQLVADKDPSLLLCGKVKARYWACYRLSTTDEDRKSCDYTYCPTVTNRCKSVPQECLTLN